jgi:transcriptional regulator with XRE-family HTH domain
MSVLRGDRVLIERRRLDMKQETLASMVGVNRSYISQIERDIDVNVGVKTVQALADALGVSVVYLLGASESPLGEPDVKVLREMAGEYVTVDVDSDDERRLIRSLIAEFNALPRRAQEAAIEMIRILRKVEEEDEKAVD